MPIPSPLIRSTQILNRCGSCVESSLFRIDLRRAPRSRSRIFEPGRQQPHSRSAQTAMSVRSSGEGGDPSERLYLDAFEFECFGDLSLCAGLVCRNLDRVSYGFAAPTGPNRPEEFHFVETYRKTI